MKTNLYGTDLLSYQLPAVVLRKYLLFTKTLSYYDKKVNFFFNLLNVLFHMGWGILTVFVTQFSIFKNYFPGSKLPPFYHSAGYTSCGN